jgi:hypothetical protein
MTREQRIAWCITQAEAIEVDMEPQIDPHEWNMSQLCAAFWRDMASRLADKPVWSA